jgi:hypothetical protein
MPENTLDREDPIDLTSKSGITESIFNGIIDQVIQEFGPVIEKAGGRLTVHRFWKDATVNAYADKLGKEYELNFFGGLARRKEITPDGFSLVVCHEMGHLIGGMPYYKNTDIAVEGQSDYFATLTCAKKIWASGEVRYPPKKDIAVPQVVVDACAGEFNGKESDLCVRSNRGSLGLATLLAVLDGDRKPSFLTPDLMEVTGTLEDHPYAQCRLDTYFAGSLDKARPRCWYDPNDGGSQNQVAVNL